MLGGDRNKAHEIIQYIEQRAGLLVGQGVRDHQQQFTFPHRAFQEYLAACHLAAQRDLEKRTHELVTTAPDQWREVAIYAARIAGTDRGVGVADTLVHRRSCDDYRRSVALTDNDWRAAVLAGLQLLEIGLQDVVTDDLYRPVCERVSNWLLRLIETPRLLPLAERIEAGNVLGRLGDPRFETIHKPMVSRSTFCRRWRTSPPGRLRWAATKANPIHTVTSIQTKPRTSATASPCRNFGSANTR